MTRTCSRANTGALTVTKGATSFGACAKALAAQTAERTQRRIMDATFYCEGYNHVDEKRNRHSRACGQSRAGPVVSRNAHVRAGRRRRLGLHRPRPAEPSFIHRPPESRHGGG